MIDRPGGARYRGRCPGEARPRPTSDPSVRDRAVAERLRNLLVNLCRPRVALPALLVLALLGAAGYLVGRSLWARQHFQAAQGALDRRDFARARAHLALCLEVWPGDAE